MSDLINFYDNTTVTPASPSSSDEKFTNNTAKHGDYKKERARTEESTFSLSTHQRVDSDILSSILASGRLGILISDRLVAHYGSLAMVISASGVELCRFGGLTKPQVLTIKAVHAAALRLISSELNTTNIVFDDKSLINYLVAFYSRSNIESFRVLFLNSCNSLISDDLMASGTINHVLPYPREILRRAIELNATALILVHNHPSGDPTPSLDDIDSTIRIRDVASALQIRVHDHIITARGKMVSFRALGLLRQEAE